MQWCSSSAVAARRRREKSYVKSFMFSVLNPLDLHCLTFSMDFHIEAAMEIMYHHQEVNLLPPYKTDATNVSWLLDTRKDTIEKRVPIYFLGCKGLLIDDVEVSRGTVFQEIRPGAGLANLHVLPRPPLLPSPTFTTSIFFRPIPSNSTSFHLRSPTSICFHLLPHDFVNLD